MKVYGRWFSVFSICAFGLLSTHLAHATNEMADKDGVRKRLGLESYTSAQISQLKIAILDNGFDGFDPKKGQLPSTAQMPQLSQIGAAMTDHGLGMAQIIWAVTGKRAEGPQFYLLNTNGFTNLKAAIQFVIDNKIDLVLYSQVWPFGGNFDGTGFINALVTRAIQTGTIWINAAGNNGGMVHNGRIIDRAKSSSQFFTFDAGRDGLRFENTLDDNSLTITLSWTDFQDSELYNTSKDLDLFVYTEDGKLLSSSELIQKGEAPPPGDSKLSSHAREAVVIKGLDRGKYLIKIRMQSSNFEFKDRYRVLLKSDKGNALTFTDRTAGGEIMPPADNPFAFTIGELSSDSAIGPTLSGLVKPDVILDDASVAFTNGNAYSGTSTAAALFAAVTAALKAEAPALSNQSLKKLITGFLDQPTYSYSDLRSAEGRKLDPTVKRLMPTGSTRMLHTNGHEVLLVMQDPYSLPGAIASRVRPTNPTDILVVSPWNDRWSVVPQAQAGAIKAPLVEIRRAPHASRTWKTPSKAELKKWVQ